MLNWDHISEYYTMNSSRSTRITQVHVFDNYLKQCLLRSHMYLSPGIQWVNSVSHSDVIPLQTSWSTSVQVMAHHFFDWLIVNTTRLRQNGHHFTDGILECIFLNQNVWIQVQISVIFFPKVQLTIFQHWLRWWLDAVQATSHYLNQWWLFYRSFTRPQWDNWTHSNKLQWNLNQNGKLIFQENVF